VRIVTKSGNILLTSFDIDAGTGKFSGVRRIFCPNFPKLTVALGLFYTDWCALSLMKKEPRDELCNPCVSLPNAACSRLIMYFAVQLNA